MYLLLSLIDGVVGNSFGTCKTADDALISTAYTHFSRVIHELSDLHKTALGI